MSTDVLTHRRLRLQFKLRTLLLLMFVVGLGLMVYRWPWEERKPQQIHAWLAYELVWWSPPRITGQETDHKRLLHGEETTTYRRGWQFRPVKHGRQQGIVEGRLIQENWFYDGLPHGTSLCYDWHGRLTCETTYRNGQLHGPFRIGDGETWVESGSFDRARETGAWQTLQSWRNAQNTRRELRGAAQVPSDAIVCQATWLRGERHGPWEWKTMAGESLSTAEFRHNRLICWNGELVYEQLQQWIDRLPRDARVLREILQQPNDAPLEWGSVQSLHANSHDHWLTKKQSAGSSTKAPERCVIHIDHDLGGPPYRNRATVAELWLEAALHEGLAFDYRYGGMWLVPASEVGGHFRDQTGAADIDFAAHSSQDQEWDHAIPMFANQNADPLSWLQYIVKGTSIKLDLSQFSSQFPVEFVPAIDSWHTNRKRCDAFGLVLYRAGLQCEQRGNTIVVKPHWTGLTSYRNRPDGKPNVYVFR